MDFEVSSILIEKAIRSFKPGSAAGLDKLTPQHLHTGQAGHCLLQALATLTNVVVSGEVPDVILPFLYGTNLIALRKVDGGIHQIAVSNVLRRLVVKSVVLLLSVEIGENVRLVQLGFGTLDGCDPLVECSWMMAMSCHKSYQQKG